MINVMKFGGPTPRGNTMALVAVDYLTKLLFLEPMLNEKADTLSRMVGVRYPAQTILPLYPASFPPKYPAEIGQLSHQSILLGQFDS